MANPTNAFPLPSPPPTNGGTTTLSPTNDIRGLKGPVEIPNPWFWVGVAATVLVLAAAVVLFVRWLKRQPVAPPLPLVPPHIRARQRIEAALRLIGLPREFCFAVSDPLRAYLEERFQLRAPERTTEEFLRELERTFALSPEHKAALAGFLEQADLVKFARFEPTEAVLRELHASALRLVDETAPVAQTIGAPTAAPPLLTPPPLLPPDGMKPGGPPHRHLVEEPKP